MVRADLLHHSRRVLYNCKAHLGRKPAKVDDMHELYQRTASYEEGTLLHSNRYIGSPAAVMEGPWATPKAVPRWQPATLQPLSSHNGTFGPLAPSTPVPFSIGSQQTRPHSTGSSTCSLLSLSCVQSDGMYPPLTLHGLPATSETVKQNNEHAG